MTPILGIDPGPKDFAAVWWDGQEAKQSGYANIEWLVLDAGYMEGVVAIEDFVVYQPLRAEGRETIKMIGAIRHECKRQKVPCIEIPRAEVLRHFGVKKGGDTALRAALTDRFGGSKAAAWGTKKEPGPLYGITGSHLLAALAVALTAWDRRESDD
jgi:hypothetical protein